MARPGYRHAPVQGERRSAEYLRRQRAPESEPPPVLDPRVNAGPPPPLLTAKQVAERLGLTVDTVHHRAAAGHLPSIQISPRVRRFLASDFPP